MDDNLAIRPKCKRKNYFSKTRTGCLTCKIRRVKCDEAKPECLRCLSTGRKCDGYTQDVLPRASGYIRPSGLPAALTRLPGNSQEKRGFQYFVEQTVVELSGFYVNPFWERLILQASFADPALRHAIVAIGALHEEFACKRLGHGLTSPSDGASFAEQQYVKAIVLLRKSMAPGKQPLLSVLLTCILFVAFDSLRGSFNSAMRHLEGGLKLLGEFKEQSTTDTSFIETDLIPLFQRLSVQAIIFVDTQTTPVRRAFVAHLQSLSTKDVEVPDTFETLEQARHTLDRVADSLFRAFYVSEPELPMSYQAEGVHAMFNNNKGRLLAWHSAFEKYMDTTSQKMTGKQLRGAAILKIHHLIASMMAMGVPSLQASRKLGTITSDEEYFDSITNEFQIIIDLASSLIAAAEQDVKNGQPPLTFSADLGLVGPLYYTCMRCQDPAIRRSGLELLSRCARREGMWDSAAAVALVKDFYDLEARHGNQMLTGESGARVHITQVVALELNDGMRMGWKWRNPFTGAPTPADPFKVDLDAGMQNLGTPLTDSLLVRLKHVVGLWN